MRVLCLNSTCRNTQQHLSVHSEVSRRCMQAAKNNTAHTTLIPTPMKNNEEYEQYTENRRTAHLAQRE